MSTNFETVPQPSDALLPLLGHVPHASNLIPEEVRPALALDNDQLEQEVLVVTDHYTDELFGRICEIGGCLFINRINRLVFDPERFRDDDREPMAAMGVGAIYTASTQGVALRENLDETQRELLLDRFYDPYASAISDAVGTLLDRFNKALLIDCHSFPLLPLSWEIHQHQRRPEFCLGTDPSHTPKELVEAVRAAVDADLLVDEPFTGSYTPSRFYAKDTRVASLMIEVRRDLYMNELDGTKTQHFDQTRSMLDQMIDAAADWFTRWNGG